LSSARANGVAIDLPKARRFALRVVAGQALITLIAGLLCWVLSGANGARSALLGGGIGTVASLAMALLSFGSRGQEFEQRVRSLCGKVDGLRPTSACTTSTSRPPRNPRPLAHPAVPPTLPRAAGSPRMRQRRPRYRS